MPSIVEHIAEIRTFLDAGEALGVIMPTHIRAKLDGIDPVGGGKLRVALVGGFSEGKTALAAAWLGRVTDDMRISQGESTDKVVVYDAGDGVELIDTPGLFGFGETSESDGGAKRFKDMTRRYVSEADLLLYVLNPSNPLKESHRAELTWLLRDLGLLPRTVFVLGRFDTVADVEDDDEYLHHLDIKRANVRARLRDLVGLTDVEEAALAIVGVAANPFDEGIESWLQRPAEHAKASHLAELREATTAALERAGGTEEVKRNTCITILSDVAQQFVGPARVSAQSLEAETALADERAKEEEPRLNRYRREAGEAQIALMNQVSDLLTDMIVEAKNTDMAGFEEFFDRKIGPDGEVLGVAIKTMFVRELGPVSRELVNMGASFVAEADESAVVAGLFGKATDAIKGGVKVSNKTVLKMRDWVMPSFKFKPHGAIKTARFANGVLVGVGIAIEGWTMLRDHQKQERFAKERQAIVDALTEQRTMLLAHLDTPDFLSTYFPQIGEMEELFAMLAAAFRDAAERNRRMRDWAAQAESLRERLLPAPDTGYFQAPGGHATVEMTIPR